MFDDNGSYKLLVGSDRGYLYMYGNIDGNLSGNVSDKNVNMSAKYRTSNLIGKSNWLTNGFSMSYLDELRFYNKCLTQEDIYGLINNETSKLIFFIEKKSIFYK